jgi:hypothetical protein
MRALEKDVARSTGTRGGLTIASAAVVFLKQFSSIRRTRFGALWRSVGRSCNIAKTTKKAFRMLFLVNPSS